MPVCHGDNYVLYAVVNKFAIPHSKFVTVLAAFDFDNFCLPSAAGTLNIVSISCSKSQALSVELLLVTALLVFEELLALASAISVPVLFVVVLLATELCCAELFWPELPRTELLVVSDATVPVVSVF